ncbi:FAD-dependent monooxygenase [Arthrobacter sp. R-11]|uniref:FAD-dependent monooxygenase n=1 Tax=Arthrobacter sp. R-11 TaxID=3404053 RepID=UPI003CF0BC51
MSIAVIGGGIAGLATAAGLAKAGAAVEVFERSSRDAVPGAGISLFPNSRAAMRTIGLLDGYEQLPHGPGAGIRTVMRRPDGKVALSFPAWARPQVRMFHRSALREFLLESCRGIPIHWDTAVTVDDDGDKLRRAVLTAADGQQSSWDLVVAADGLRSTTRRFLSLDPGLRYAGYTAWRGVTRGPADTGGTAGEDWGSRQRFGTVPLADGRVYWFAVATKDEGRTAAADGLASEKEAAEREFASWYPAARTLIAGTDEAEVLRHDLYDLARPLHAFHRGRVALAGDAAHAMTPDLGQGAGAGLEDAAALTALVRSALAGGAAGPDTDVVGLLGRYSRLRAPKAARQLRASRLMGRLAQRDRKAWRPGG